MGVLATETVDYGPGLLRLMAAETKRHPLVLEVKTHPPMLRQPQPEMRPTTVTCVVAIIMFCFVFAALTWHRGEATPDRRDSGIFHHVISSQPTEEP